MKKGQGLTLNTIVIAALVIIVLVVLTILIGSTLGWFAGEVGPDVQKCDGTIGGKTYEVKNSLTECAEAGGIQDVNKNYNAAGEKIDFGQICCEMP
ncbi:hypothetical protein ACFL1H_00220 [Nanoarchaeota archaeon]